MALTEKNRRIVVDIFEVVHFEELGDDMVNYTKKKLGTTVLDFDPEEMPLWRAQYYLKLQSKEIIENIDKGKEV